MDKFLSLFSAVDCSAKPNFFGLPTWNKYLDKLPVSGTDPSTGQQNVIVACTPTIRDINDFWLIGAAVLDMLVRLAAIAAIAMVVYGGIMFITSQNEPDKTKQARGTIINALVGLVIAVAATGLVSFIAGRFN